MIATCVRWAGTLGVLLWLQSCTAFGPSRKPPVMPQPEHYAVETQEATLPEADGIAQHLDAASASGALRDWWTAFGSAELDALVAEGLRNSPSLAAAQSTLQAAREQVRQQIGQNLLPQVDAGFAPSRQRALEIPNLPQQTFLYNVFAAQGQASYALDFFGAAFLADRALAGQVRQQALQLEATRRGLATNIVVATINAASMNEQVETTERLVLLGEQRARQLADRYQLGGVPRDDMLAAEQDAANAAASLPGLRAQALAMRHAQAVLLGRTPDQAPAPLSLDALHLPGSLPVVVPSELLHRRPDVLAAEAALRAAADEAGAATAAMFPSLSLTASYGRGGFDWSSFTSPAGAIWSVGANLSQPVFHGGALLARRRQYLASYDASVAQYRQTVLGAFRNVADTLVSLDEDAQTLAQTERAERAAQAMAGDTTSRYQLGATSFYLTLTAGQQLENARNQSTRARAARLADSAALFDEMGDPLADSKVTIARQ
jgi:NodT family efflux transporter outer membrane factor (OMF) lipoprotein